MFERLRLLRVAAGRSTARESRARVAEKEMRKAMASGAGGERLLGGEEKALGKLEVRARLTFFFHFVALRILVRLFAPFASGQVQTVGWCFFLGWRAVVFGKVCTKKFHVSRGTTSRNGLALRSRACCTFRHSSFVIFFCPCSGYVKRGTCLRQMLVEVHPL